MFYKIKSFTTNIASFLGWLVPNLFRYGWVKDSKKVLLLIIFPLWGLGGFAQTLNDYLQEAAKNNPQLKASYAGFEAALQKAPQVSSLPDPTLTMSAFGRMIETRIGTQEARFSLVQTFPWFGTLKAQKDAATATAEARFQDYLNQRSLLFVEVKSRYAELYVLDKTIALKEENIAILDSYRELALSGFSSGNAPMVNVITVDLERETAKTEVDLLKLKKKPLEAQFNLLLNRNKELKVAINDSLVLNKNLLDDTQVLAALEQHPSMVAFENEQQALSSQMTAIEKDGLPKIGLGVDYSIISKRTDANPDLNGRDAIMPMLSVSLPIFRKKYKAAKQEVEWLQQQVEARKNQQKNKLQSEVEMVVYELLQTQKLLQLYENQLERIGQATQLYVTGFANNTADFEAILRTNQQKLQIQTQQLEALKNGFVAQAQWEYLLFKNDEL